MSWKIKDEKVEKAIKALFLDDKSYQEAIDYGYEYAEAHEHKWLVICGGTKFGINEMIGNICVEISLDKTDVEFVPEYDPNDWNEYPNVKPPKGVPMRIEYKDREGNIVRECAVFLDDKGAPLPSYWFSARSLGKIGCAVDDAYSVDDNNYLVEDGMELRFRPWED